MKFDIGNYEKKYLKTLEKIARSQKIIPENKKLVKQYLSETDFASIHLPSIQISVLLQIATAFIIFFIGIPSCSSSKKASINESYLTGLINNLKLTSLEDHRIHLIFLIKLIRYQCKLFSHISTGPFQ